MEALTTPSNSFGAPAQGTDPSWGLLGLRNCCGLPDLGERASFPEVDRE
jgi:hypothetical protein